MKISILVLALFLAMSAMAEKAAICLNMIVKDEAKVIEACLASVKPIVDYWVIVDTGSSDKTREIIQEFMKGVPGELHERPWINFAHNRNEALQLAKDKGDYVLLIDADEVLSFSSDFALPKLDKDLYYIPVRQIGAADVRRNGLLNNRLNWKWEGVLHEIVTCPDAKSSEMLKGVVNLCNTHGECASGRSQNSQIEKYLRDAALLEKALLDEPNNSRYVYYLAISYSAAKKYELAKKNFERRAAMPSTDAHETYLTLYNLGMMQEILGESDEAIESLFKASAMRPFRAEPLFQIAKIYRKKGNILLGYLLSKHALEMPYPAEEMCVEYVIYDHTLLIEFANCSLLLGKFDEGYEACKKLLANPNLPAEYKPQVTANFHLAASKRSMKPDISPKLLSLQP